MTAMKKQFHRYISGLVILVGLVAGSCTDLSETVYSELLAEQFVPTEKDIPAIIAPVYTGMRSMMAGWQGMFDLREEPADQIVTPARPNGWYDGGTYQRMHKHTGHQPSGSPRTSGITVTGVSTLPTGSSIRLSQVNYRLRMARKTSG